MAQKIIDLTRVIEPTEQHAQRKFVVHIHGIPLIENLTNLALLTQPRVQVYALPVPVKGLDAFPLRVIAMERTDDSIS